MNTGIRDVTFAGHYLGKVSLILIGLHISQESCDFCELAKDVLH